ncbi:MAG: GtrA family protein [Verrucomicrobiae bacterium]|nr:GtrA family protein [Verrucomicrobiae bacterium]
MDRGWGDTLDWLHSRDAPPTAQFLKYAVCGGVAVVVQLIIVILLGNSVLPAFESAAHPELTPALRETNLKWVNLIAFPFANFAAYFLNVYWVFTPGRHSRWREFWLFTLVSAISFGAGMFGGPELIGWFGVPSWFAQIGFMVTSALVNFVCRKFFIFER